MVMVKVSLETLPMLGVVLHDIVTSLETAREEYVCKLNTRDGFLDL